MSRAGVLEAFSRALTLETHHLFANPALLLQQLQNRLQWEDDEVRALLDAMPRSGRRKAVIRSKTRIRESPALRTTIDAHTPWAEDCAIAPNGEYVVSVGSDGMARQWDVATGKEMHSLRIADAGNSDSFEFRSGATCCAVSPDGAFVVCGGASGTVKSWDPRTGRETWGVSESSFSVNTCAVSPDNSRIVWTRVNEISGMIKARGSVLRIWELGGADRSIELSGYLLACALSPDGALVAIARSGGLQMGEIEVRNVRSGARLWKNEHPAGRTFAFSEKEFEFPPEIRDCAFSPDGGFVVTAAADASLRLWRARSGTWFQWLTAEAEMPESSIQFRQDQTLFAQKTACAVTPDGLSTLSGSRGGALSLRNIADGAPVATLEGHGDEVTACAVSADGTFAASSSRDGTVRIWDLTIAQGG